MIDNINKILNKIESLDIEVSDQNLVNRKNSGSFYTPIDVAENLVNSLFDSLKIQNIRSLKKAINNNVFIEPSVGSGIFLFSLVKKILEFNIDPKYLKNLKVHLIDINPKCITFIRKIIKQHNLPLDPEYYSQDFLKYKKFNKNKNTIVFGNPPFVKLSDQMHSNLYESFITHSILNDCDVYFIVPFSIIFSKDFNNLRLLFKQYKCSANFSNYDNIPDCLFNFGKPDSLNSNRANSQRCSIISIVKNKQFKITSSPLTRWKKSQRSEILHKQLKSFDITNLFLKKNIYASPLNNKIIKIFCNDRLPRLGNFFNFRGPAKLHVAQVARNFISIREKGGPSVHTFYFISIKEKLHFLTIISSKQFFEYWRSFGDGFHLTKSNISQFPVTKKLENFDDKRFLAAKKIYFNQSEYKFSRKILNNRVVTLNFLGVFDEI